MIHLGRLFVSMALMYPWATKDYLLWDMSIGQIIMYHNMGTELKYGTGKKSGGLLDKGEDELRAMRDDVRDRFEAEARRAELRAKYGDIDD